MASKILRCFLLIVFLYTYSYLTSWYQEQLVKDTNQSSIVPHPVPIGSDGCCLKQSNETKSCLAYVSTVNYGLPCVQEKPELGGRHQSLPVDTPVLNSPPKALDAPQPTGHLTISKTDLIQVSFWVVNALTILDIFLSRRTKPWKFFLRILYRIGRSNFKWALLWATIQVWSQFEGYQSDTIEVTVEPLATTCHQMQQLWATIQSQPVLLTCAFFIYNVMVSWILQRLVRQDVRRPDPTTDGVEVSARSSSDQADGTGRRRPVSKWWLLIDCLFRPLSLETANSLMDFELDESVEFLIEWLALPNLWLTPTVPTDYSKYLPVWRFGKWSICTNQAQVVCLNDAASPPVDHGMNRPSNEDDQPPSNMKWIASADCAICLDKYSASVDVCGLPCGHQFHHNCIMVWLQRDNHHCPICRWPAYQSKYLSIM